MADDTRDTLMQIVLNGNPLPAEASALIASDDVLAKDLLLNATKVSQDAATGRSAWSGQYFALTNFQLDVKLLGDQSDDEASRARTAQKEQKAIRTTLDSLALAVKNAASGKLPLQGRSLSEFTRFMQRGSSALTQKAYPSDLDKVSFTKQLDRTSTKLFDACVNFTVFDSATIIKRRGIGDQMLKTYLKIKFTDLLITDFDWQEDDVVKESIKFVCRSADVTYATQEDTGKFKSATINGAWSRANLKT